MKTSVREVNLNVLQTPTIFEMGTKRKGRLSSDLSDGLSTPKRKVLGPPVLKVLQSASKSRVSSSALTPITAPSSGDVFLIDCDQVSFYMCFGIWTQCDSFFSGYVSPVVNGVPERGRAEVASHSGSSAPQRIAGSVAIPIECSSARLSTGNLFLSCF